MKKIVDLIIPNKTDAILLIACVIGICGVVACSGQYYAHWTGDSLFFVAPLIGCIAVTLAGIAVVIGWGRFSPFRTVFLLIVCCLGFAVSALLIWWNDPEAGNSSWGSSYQWWYLQPHTDRIRQSYLQIFGSATALLIGGFLTVLIGTFLFRMAPRLMARVNLQFLNRWKLTRPGILIAVAVCLFVIATANNVLKASGIVHTENPVTLSLRAAVGVVGLAVAFLFLFVLPGWCLILGKKRWPKVFFSVVFVFVLTAIFVNSPVGFAGIRLSHTATTAIFQVAFFVVCGFLYFLTITILKQPHDTAGEASDSSTVVRTARIRPSIWSLGTLLVFVVTLLVAASVDVLHIAQLYQSNLSNPLKATAQSIWLNLKTGGQIGGSNGNYICRFTPDTDPDILAKINPAQGTQTYQLFGLHPGIKTKSLRNLKSKQVSICGGRITTSQMEDLFLNAGGFSFMQDIDIDDSQGKAKIDSTAILQLYDEHPGRIGKLFSAIDQFVNPQQIYIHSKISPEDWPGIVHGAQAGGRISVFGRLPEELPLVEAESLKNITIQPVDYYRPADELNADVISLLLDTDIQVSINTYLAGTMQFYWDICFAIPDRITEDPEIVVKRLKDFEFRQFHLAYGFDNNGEITDLFLPGGEEIGEVRELENLKTLSFDVRWLGRTPGLFNRIQSLNHLSRLTKLERLYLSENVLAIPDMSFLQSLTSLKHLQISAVERNSQGPVGFDCCPSLESITFFGKPDTTTIGELKNLKNLKSVMVVDSANEFDSFERAEKRIGKLLPGIKVSLVDPLHYKPETPEAFNQHLRKTKDAVFRKLLKTSANSETARKPTEKN